MKTTHPMAILNLLLSGSIAACGAVSKKKSSSAQEATPASPAASLKQGDTVEPGVVTTKNIFATGIVALGLPDTASSLSLADSGTPTDLAPSIFAFDANGNSENLLTDAVESAGAVTVWKEGVNVSVVLKNVTGADRFKTLFFPIEGGDAAVNAVDSKPAGESNGKIYSMYGSYYDTNAKTVGHLDFYHEGNVGPQVIGMSLGVMFIQDLSKNVCYFFDTDSGKKLDSSCDAATSWSAIDTSTILLSKIDSSVGGGVNSIVNIATGETKDADVSAPSILKSNTFAANKTLSMISGNCPGDLVNFVSATRLCQVSAAEGKATTLLDTVFSESDTLLAAGASFIIKSTDSITQVSPVTAASLVDAVPTYATKVLLTAAVKDVKVSGNTLVFTTSDGKSGQIDLTTAVKKDFTSSSKISQIFPVSK